MKFIIQNILCKLEISFVWDIKFETGLLSGWLWRRQGIWYGNSPSSTHIFNCYIICVPLCHILKKKSVLFRDYHTDCSDRFCNCFWSWISASASSTARFHSSFWCWFIIRLHLLFYAPHRCRRISIVPLLLSSHVQ